MPAPTSITASLCTQCGLCCDGTIFDDIELPDDAIADRLSQHDLDIEPGTPPLLLLPCTALCENKHCGIYDERPTPCRTFECRLLQKTERGQLPLEQALDIVAQTTTHAQQVNQLCEQLEESDAHLPLRMRCAEALAQPICGDDDRANDLRQALAQAMDTMGHLLNSHFVGDESD